MAAEIQGLNLRPRVVSQSTKLPLKKRGLLSADADRNHDLNKHYCSSPHTPSMVSAFCWNFESWINNAMCSPCTLLHKLACKLGLWSVITPIFVKWKLMLLEIRLLCYTPLPRNVKARAAYSRFHYFCTIPG